MSKDKLLTIAIPTYNRAVYLDICLSHITSQLHGYESQIELIVSNNCSTDNTASIVNNYIAQGADIEYVCNSENIGADRNFLQCFNLAKGKYVVIFGDDDIFLEGSLAKIMAILQNGVYGLVHVNSFGFQNNYLEETPKKRSEKIFYYNDHEELLKKVNYWITFASGNIFNKSLLPHDFAPEKFNGTYLAQLYWYLSALFAAKQNVYVAEYLVAFKTSNTGGYDLCDVFGVNINKIFEHFVASGIPNKYFNSVNSKLVETFLPFLILNIRKMNSNFQFENVDFYRRLTPVYRHYLYYWLITVPIIKLPVKNAHYYFRVVHFAVRLLHKIRP
jgi:glycosyltransferase involved in cell wall biosynthesis